MFKTRPIAYSLALAFGGLAAAGVVNAQTQPAPQQKLDRVEITGSSIRRADVETVVPVAVYTKEEINRTGATTAAEILEFLPMNSGQGVQTSTALGDAARPGQNAPSLRGLGPNRTLVLVDGRRLTPFAFGGDGTDINQIPAAIIDKVEILRDGASAIYGTDAIGGVINFITRRDYQGADVGASYSQPQQSGGKQYDANVTLGYGDLGTQRFNVWGALSYQKRDPIAATDRWFSKSAYIPNAPGGTVNKLSSNAVPANIFLPNGTFFSPAAPFYNGGTASQVTNPQQGYYAPGCSSPISFGLTGADRRCRYDYASTIDIVPPFEQIGAQGKFTFQLTPNVAFFVSAFDTEFKQKYKISAVPASEATTFNGDPVLYPAGGKYYPTGANLPAMSGDLNLYWRTLAAGPRTTEVKTNQGRVVAGSEGMLAGWDYNVALSSAWSKATENYIDGYLSEAKLLNAKITPGVTTPGCVPYTGGLISPKNCGYTPGTIDPNINPFSLSQDAAGAAALQRAKIIDETRNSKFTRNAVDGKASREIFELPAGPVGLALGFEVAHEEYKDNFNPIVSSGNVIGGAGDQQSVAGDRDVRGIYAETIVPVIKSVTAQVAVRYDNYSDFGSTTNPKVGVRWQPTSSLLFRGSWMTGFRAPTLDNLYSPQSRTNTGGVYNDPNYERANGGPGACAANAPTFNPTYCGAQFNVAQGGNKSLDAEKSNQFSVGVVFEPVREFSIGVDYFNIQLKDSIGIINGDTKFQDYIDNYNFATGTSSSRYASSISKNAQGYTSLIDSRFENIAKERTSGIDLDVKATLMRSAYGTLKAGFLGTYLLTSESKLDGDSEWSNSVGEYSRSGPIQRFRGTTQLTWGSGPWEGTIMNVYYGGYNDQNGNREVEAYTLWNLQGVYKGIKSLTLTAGILNLFNEAPPYSNQNSYFQVGYDPTYTDPRGRTYYVRANYAFK